ncbi:MAG: 3-ketoacyl-ACP reductase [Paenibacillus sp.]|jgi:NAD(P)-dependent dehydrogenase (short-subunit alcohol dehydrogenase family)|nr:3-ketoacyl-ACP reductase [Paenibacillus sp.]
MRAFDGKVVGITGAGAGIGRVLALRYAEQGAEVVLLDRDEKGLQQTKELLQSSGFGASLHQVDLSQSSEIEQVFRLLKDKPGRIDVWINNAGLGKWKSPYDLAVDEWDYIMNTNLRGTFLCSREAARIMKEHGGGAIVNIASTRAFMSEANSEAYAATKGGIVSLTHALAVSLGPDRITVNVVSPGWIETGDYTKLREEDHHQHPSMRVGQPDDIARACFYLTDSRNDFVTGINLTVDGGMTKKMMYVE